MSIEALVRRWVWLYTLGIAPELRARRRAEIDSDLWEQRQSREDTNSSFSILGRWLAGVPDDIAWRAFTRSTTEGESVSQIGRHWWRSLSALSAVFTAYFGVRQVVTDEVSPELTAGKVVALLIALGAAACIVGGLLLSRVEPRRGSALVLVGLFPLAAVSGFGLMSVAGLLFSIISGEGWWWLPVGVASAIATLAGLGAFATWWNSTQGTRLARINVLPASLVLGGLLTARISVGLGVSAIALALGVLSTAVGLIVWRRRVNAT